MAYTRHGHQIPGTIVEEIRPVPVRCGGIRLCNVCAIDYGRYHREHLEAEHEKLIQDLKAPITKDDILTIVLNHSHSYKGQCECGEWIGSNPAVAADHIAAKIYEGIQEKK